MKPIIEVRNLSKQYKIGKKQKYLSLRDSVTDFFKNKGQKEEYNFWALDDVSFDVQAGESIGIIGKNGAGKSTLLKILSRITPPTKGKVILRGRMASLLEVGTGFHPELTGRENVYFNASILGLRKIEVNKKFDEIVAFSGVEQFIDTPLKHYSSGMQLRLAFAVAAHLEPEILVIDEVLAVGDAEFQKKCLGKMDEVSKSGRTVLFVSHNLTAVRHLCTTSIMFDKGIIINKGQTSAVIDKYLELKNIQSSRIETVGLVRRFNSNSIRIETLIISDGQVEKNEFVFGDNLEMTFTIKAFQSHSGINAFILIKAIDGTYIYSPFQSDNEESFSIDKNQILTLKATIQGVRLLPGTYSVDIGLFELSFSFLEWIEDITSFTIQDSYFLRSRLGYLSPSVSWLVLNEK